MVEDGPGVIGLRGKVSFFPSRNLENMILFFAFFLEKLSGSLEIFATNKSLWFQLK